MTSSPGLLAFILLSFDIDLCRDSYLQRFISPEIHISRDPYLLRSISTEIHLSRDSSLERSISPEIYLSRDPSLWRSISPALVRWIHSSRYLIFRRLDRKLRFTFISIIHFIKIFNSQDPEEVVAMTPPVESVTELTNGDVEDVTDKTALIQPHRE